MLYVLKFYKEGCILYVSKSNKTYIFCLIIDHEVGLIMKGFWITFEGVGGSGKSTQTQKLFEWMQQRNIPSLLTKEHGGTPVGQEIGRIVKSVQEPKLESLTEILLFEADRHETYRKVVKPNTSQGYMVLSDR